MWLGLSQKNMNGYKMLAMLSSWQKSSYNIRFLQKHLPTNKIAKELKNREQYEGLAQETTNG